MTARLSPPRFSLVPLALALPLVAAACSGGGTQEATGEVASLDTDGDSLAAAADAATIDDQAVADLSPDEAALDFSQCMRDEGLEDFPDLSVNAEGDIELRDAFQAVDREADGFQEAQEACADILEQTGFGGGRREALNSTEIEDALLEFTDCVRDAGYDVGDLTLAGPGQGADRGQDDAAEGDEAAADETTDEAEEAEGDEAAAGGDGEGRGAAEGQRQQGFGDRGARFAQNLGLDYEDAEVQETIDTCMPLVEEAFADAGVGQQPEGE